MNPKNITLLPNQLQRYQAKIIEQLGAKDQERLTLLTEILDPSDGKANLATTYKTLFPEMHDEQAAAAFRKFRLNFNNAAKEAGHPDVQLSGDTKKKSPNDKRACWIVGPDTVIAEIEELSRAGAANTEDHEPLPSRLISTDQKIHIRFFVSYSHENDQDKVRLLSLLQQVLEPSGKYHFELWTDGDITLGEKWHDQIQDALQACDIGLLLVSPSFLSSNYIKEQELPAFVNGDKPCIPVELKAIDFKNHNLHGLAERQFFRLKKSNAYKAFSQLNNKQDREAFASDLSKRIFARLDTHPPDPKPKKSVTRPLRSKPQIHEIAETSAIDLDCPGGFIPTRARPWGIGHKQAAETKPATGSEDHDAVQFLRDWALNPKEAPFFALLGEYGMGKTTTLKQFTRRLLEEREKNSDLPLPIYIDLRHRMSPKNGVPHLAEILDNALRRNWRKSETLTVNAEQLIHLARQGKAIVLFDGLDEQIVHYSEADAQTFIRELWSITPHGLIGGPNPRSTKVLISCRSHYFKDLKQQDNMLTGEQREGLKPSHYKVAFILPFTEEQIRSYLNQELGEEGGGRAWTLLAEIHDLQDLAKRPYLLSLITSHVEQLEQLKTTGQPIRPITLYQIMTRKWLDRDAGKHHIDSDHKPRIMAALAADMHIEGVREWPWARLMKWFDSFLPANPDLAHAYQNKDRALLLEDLRTASFILRPDTEDQNFRFAHSSLLEYFLSVHLHEGLVAGKPETWDMPKPSRETLRFVGEWLDDTGRGLETLASLLEANPFPQATLNAFHYYLLAAAEGLPLPRPAYFSLSGQDLPDLEIGVPPEAPPLLLANADFSNANLRRTKWRNVNLIGSKFAHAELSQSDFADCLLNGSDFIAADLIAANFSDCAGTGVLGGVLQAAPAFLHRCKGLSGERAPETGRTIGNALLALEPRSYSLMAVFSPDGRSIVSASHDGTLRLWGAATAKCLLTFEGHKHRVNSAAFSPDGRSIVSAGSDGTLRLWDAAFAICLLTFEGHKDSVNSAVFSPDGRSIVSAGSDGTLRLWDAASAECLLTFKGHKNRANSAAFSPDGRSIVSAGSDGTLLLWDAFSAECLLALEGHENEVTAASFSPDGRSIVSAGSDGNLRLWDAASAKCLLTFEGHKHRVNSAAFSSDGCSIVSAGFDGTLRLWATASAKCLLTFEEHNEWVSYAAFSPDGRSILSASDEGTLRLWDTASAACLLTFEGREGWISSAAFSPDGRSIASAGSDGKLRLWDAASAKCLLTFEGHNDGNTFAAFSPDGRSILSVSHDGTLRLWDAATTKCLLTFEGHKNWVNSAAFSPDGHSIVSAGSGGKMHLWDVASAKCLLTIEGPIGWRVTAAFSPDGRSIVSAGSDGTLRLWDAASAKCLLTFDGHKDSVNSAAFSPDGRCIVSAGSDGTLRLWDAASAKCLLTFEGHEREVISAAFSPDGCSILSAGSDGKLRLWDAASSKCILILEGHKGWVKSVAFSPDGRSIVSSGYDGTLRLWDAASGREIYAVTGHRRNENACVVLGENRILWAEKDAWRHIRWMLPPSKDQIYPTPVPGDYFEEFPIGLSE